MTLTSLKSLKSNINLKFNPALIHSVQRKKRMTKRVLRFALLATFNIKVYAYKSS